MLKHARHRLNLAFAFIHDAAMAIAAWCIAYWLRFNLEIPEAFVDGMIRSLLWVVPIQLGVFLAFGLYRGMWRFASLTDLRRITFAVGVSAAIIPTMLFMTKSHLAVPRSVLIFDPLLLVMLISGSRLAYRYFRERRLNDLLSAHRRPVLVLGAGEAAERLIMEFGQSQEWRVVGLLDDDPGKHGRNIHGVRVLGALASLPQAAQRLGAEHAIIAMPSVSHAIRRRAMDLCTAAQIKALTVPSFDDLVGGKVTVSQIRNVEVDDLLGRDPVELNSAGLGDWIRGNTIMVTGAGGSIGSELCRQIARFEPKLLVLFEQNEFALYTIEEEFRAGLPKLALAGVIGDVRNGARLADALHRYRPKIVFHAAAYKHVPLMENENAWEAVQNNVLGTLRLAQAAREYGVSKFVLISTDKAVNPTNVMGATKRLAEMVCSALQPGSSSTFVTVRFGNVLGSTGSVIPKFRRQIAAGGPVTVTHPEVTRYFMSIPEAAQLVLQAGLMGKGGELFVLDMGDPIRIVDLAREMIRLSGFSDAEIRIEFTGLRSGEKLYEEPLAQSEGLLATPHPKLRIAKAGSGLSEPVLLELRAWIERDAVATDEDVRAMLSHFVAEYRPAP
jgi:FlaA1/EpsC-like NDP-sugar epimerase